MVSMVLSMRLILYFLTLAISVITFLLGLNFKGEDFNNTILTLEKSLKFTNGSFAIGDLELTEESFSNLKNYGFIMSFEIKPDDSDSRRTRFLLRLISKSNHDNVLNIFFWKNQLIANIGDDFNYKKRKPRVAANLENKKYFIDILFFNDFMSLYLDKELYKRIDLSGSRFEVGLDGLKIIFGGHVDSQRSWRGELFEFSFSSLLNHNSIDVLNSTNSKPLYGFVINRERINYIGSISGTQLLLPPYPVRYQRVLLRKNSFLDLLTSTTILDIVVNFSWFALLSFFLFLSLSNVGFSSFLSFFGSFLLAFVFSLLIEGVQSWLPMRDSSVRDLVLNVAGGFFGAAFMYLLSFNDYFNAKFNLNK